MKNRLFPKSWQTLAMRLAIRQSILLSVLALTAMLILYGVVTNFVIAQISSDLKYSLQQLSKIETQKGSNELISRLNKLAALENESRGHSHRYYLYLSRGNTNLAGTLRHWPDDVKTNQQVTNVLFDEQALPIEWADVDEGLWPTIATQFADGSKLLITQSIDSAEQLNDLTLFVMIFLVIAVTLISLFLGWRQGKTILEKIEAINQTARKVESGDINQRVTLKTTLPNKTQKLDEFDELGLHLNKMLDTIEKLMHDMRQVSQNIAHDLRKPLTRIQAKLENLQSTPQILPADLDTALEDMANLSKTFNALLQLGRLESFAPNTQFQPFNLSELCEDLNALYQEMAIDKTLTWQSQIEMDIWILGNRQLFAQAIINLLENALEYSKPTQQIRFNLTKTDQCVILKIENTGITLTDEQLDAIVKPFVRLDAARTANGNGLGLSLVKAIFTIHDSKLSLETLNHTFSAKGQFKWICSLSPPNALS